MASILLLCVNENAPVCIARMSRKQPDKFTAIELTLKVNYRSPILALDQ